MVRIAIVGDHRPENPTHVATDAAYADAAAALGVGLDAVWVPTVRVAADADGALAEFDGIMAAPGTYADMDGALSAIRLARERRVPFLGTCAGFQHAVIEVARNVVGLAEAAHGETDPSAAHPVVRELECSLRGERLEIALETDGIAAALYAAATAPEDYFCSYGVAPEYWPSLRAAGLRVTGRDRANGDPRLVEIPGHPFFLAALYVPQVGSRAGAPHPLVRGHVAAAAGLEISS